MHDIFTDTSAIMAETPKVFDWVNFAYGSVIGFFALIFGEHWILFAGFLLLNIVDWGSGYYKSHIKNIESSVEGAKGAMKKVWYWVVIGIAFFVSNSFAEMGEVIGTDLSFVTMFGWLTLAMYLVNELRSILENLVEIGVEVPGFLVKGLDVTRKLMDAEMKNKENNTEEEGE